MVEHINRARNLPGFETSVINIYVERNLGFEACHHERALSHIPGVVFYRDEQADRVGVLTTNATKHAMAKLVQVMLGEQRISIRKPIISRDPAGALVKLREQMEVYSYQFKAGQDTFQTDKIAISGKVGGMRDDICICLQLGCYFTQLHCQRQNQFKRARVT